MKSNMSEMFTTFSSLYNNNDDNNKNLTEITFFSIRLVALLLALVADNL